MAVASTNGRFAYILIVECDKELRESALNTIDVPNCAVDTVQDEDEAVYKARQHRPQLIIVKRHEPLNINVWKPPRPSAASLICRRAHLSTAVRLVTHSDVAVTAHLALKPEDKLPPMTPSLQQRIEHMALDRHLFSNPQQPVLVRPKFVGQDWRKEWYLYCGREQTMEFLSHHIPFFLGWVDRSTSPIFKYFRIHSLGATRMQDGVLMIKPPYYCSFRNFGNNQQALSSSISVLS